MGIEIDVGKLAMSAINSVYCNYFVATASFWKNWLIVAEFIYSLSLNDHSTIGNDLRANTTYIKEPLPMKIFIIERLASMLLAKKNNWNISPRLIFNNMHYRATKEIPILERLLILDSLKSSFIQTRNINYLQTFNNERTLLMKNYGMSV